MFMKVERQLSSGQAQQQRVVLGIDPGYGMLGYAVVSACGHEVMSLHACAAISTPGTMPLANRLLHIYQQLTDVVRVYQPCEAAIEKLFFGRNTTTAIAVAQARGIALLVLVQHGLSISEYTPNEVKLAVTGYGAAKKGQVGQMVRLLLHLDAVPQPDDAADAAAIAICHVHTVHIVREACPSYSLERSF